MSIFSRSSRGHHYRNGNLGSGYYQRGGILKHIFGVISSGYDSHNPYYPPNTLQNNHPLQNEPTPCQAAIFCGKCNSKIPSGSKFCLECGEKVGNGLYCAGCGQALPQGAKFCMKCGQKAND